MLLVSLLVSSLFTIMIYYEHYHAILNSITAIIRFWILLLSFRIPLLWNFTIIISITTGWWYTYPSEKYESQLGFLFPIDGKHEKCSKPSIRLLLLLLLYYYHYYYTTTNSSTVFLISPHLHSPSTATPKAMELPKACARRARPWEWCAESIIYTVILLNKYIYIYTYLYIIQILETIIYIYMP